MKSNIGQINKRFNDVIETMPLEKVQQLYFNEAYASYRALWIDLDIQRFEKKFEECMGILEAVQPNIVHELVFQDAKAMQIVCYDLRNELDQLKNLSGIIAHALILHDLKLMKKMRAHDFDTIESARVTIDFWLGLIENDILKESRLNWLEQYLVIFEGDKDFYNKYKEFVNDLRNLYDDYIENKFE